MIFISAQPDEIYFLWQLKVQISNLIKVGLPYDYHILIRYRETINPKFVEFAMELKDTQFKFFFYKDSRVDWKQYVSSLRPYTLKQHFEKNDISEFFYLDSDVIFRELPDFSLMGKGNFCSDTISYIGTDYITRKDPTGVLLETMCGIVGIDPVVCKERVSDSGGAQYLIREVDASFWEKVEKDCVALYLFMHNFNAGDQTGGIQAWCADMWAVLWNLWLIGDCKVHKELDFSWPTQSLRAYNNTKIFHNAGVTQVNKHELFLKSDYLKSEPFGDDFSYVNKDKGSIKYIEEIQTCIFQKNRLRVLPKVLV